MHLVSPCTKTSPVTKHAITIFGGGVWYPLPKATEVRATEELVASRCREAGPNGWDTWIYVDMDDMGVFNREQFDFNIQKGWVRMFLPTHIFHGNVMAQSLQVERLGQSSSILLDAEMM